MSDQCRSGTHETNKLRLSIIASTAEARIRYQPGNRVEVTAHDTVEVRYSCGEAKFKLTFTLLDRGRLVVQASLKLEIGKFRIAVESRADGVLDSQSQLWDQVERKCAEEFYSDPKLQLARKVYPTSFKRLACLQKSALSTARRMVEDVDTVERVELVDHQVNLF